MKSYQGKIIFGVLALSFSVLACFSAAHAYSYTDLGNMGLMSLNDPWNMSPHNPAGNQVDSYSPTIGNPDYGPNRIFGSYGTGDPDDNTIFKHGSDVKSVEWHTAQPITLIGCNLFALLDWNNGNPVNRAISNFSLYYSLDQGQSWTSIIDNFATLVGQNDQGLYNATDAPSWAKGLAAGFSFDPVTASYFRAEFTQLDVTGARICELDAITANTVPLPGAIWLLGSGLVSLAAYRRLVRK